MSEQQEQQNSNNNNNGNSNFNIQQNTNHQQQQPMEPAPPPDVQIDMCGNIVRGRGGDLMGVDRGPVRGGAFENVGGQQLTISEGGASSSVDGWIVMFFNLSENVSDSDLELLISDVDPYANMLGGGGGGGGGSNNEKKFILDLKINVSAATCKNVGHAFVKVANHDHAQLLYKLDGTEFVDEMPVRVSLAFAAPVQQPERQSEQEQEGTTQHQQSQQQMNINPGTVSTVMATERGNRFRGRGGDAAGDNNNNNNNNNNNIGPAQPPRPGQD